MAVSNSMTTEMSQTRPLFAQKFAAGTLALLFLFLPVFLLVFYRGAFVIAFGGLFMVLALYLMERQGRLLLTSAALPVFLFFGICALSVLWSPDPTTSALRSLTTLLHIVVFYLALIAAWNGRYASMRTILTVIIVSIALISLWIILTYGQLRASKGVMKEAVGSFSNYAAAMAVSLIPFFLVFQKDGPTSRRVYGALVLLCVAVAVASLSRAAMLLAVLAVLGGAWAIPAVLGNRLSRITAYLLLGSAGFFFLVVFLGYESTIGGVIERLGNSQLFDSGVASPAKKLDDFKRTAMYAAGFDAIRNHPITGIGYGTLPDYVDNLYKVRVVSHNIIITYWGEMGAIGLAVLLFCLYQLGIHASRRVPVDLFGSRDHQMRNAAFISIAITFLQSMFRPIEGNYVLPVALAIFVVACVRLSRARRKSRTQSSFKSAARVTA